MNNIKFILLIKAQLNNNNYKIIQIYLYPIINYNKN